MPGTFFSKLLTGDVIDNTKVLQWVLWCTLCIISVILVCELVLDLAAIEPYIIAPSLLLMLVFIFLANKERYRHFVTIGFLLTVYTLLESSFFESPVAFHDISFWYAFVPAIALIIGGIRNALFWTLISVGSIIFNGWYVFSLHGLSYNVDINVVPFIIMLSLFNMAALVVCLILYRYLNNAYSQSRKQSDNLLQLNKRLAEYQLRLFHLSKQSFLREGNLDQTFKQISKIATENLHISRVSIWTFEKAPERLVRRFLFKATGETDSDYFELKEDDYPKYFETIRKQHFIKATNASTHPETREFRYTYLEPLDIHSMLDCAILLDGEVIGVICCEELHQQRVWTSEDGLFVQALSDLIAIAYKSKENRELIERVKSQNIDLVEKRNEIEVMNEELQAMNEELISNNDMLEEQIQARTQELALQNQQLTEYAFINSHLLRAPLSRIQGLSHLISLDTSSNVNNELVTALLGSTKELDDIIKKISDLLYDGNDFSREDIQHLIDKNLKKIK